MKQRNNLGGKSVLVPITNWPLEEFKNILPGLWLPME